MRNPTLALLVVVAASLIAWRAEAGGPIGLEERIAALDAAVTDLGKRVASLESSALVKGDGDPTRADIEALALPRDAVRAPEAGKQVLTDGQVLLEAWLDVYLKTVNARLELDQRTKVLLEVSAPSEVRDNRVAAVVAAHAELRANFRELKYWRSRYLSRGAK